MAQFNAAFGVDLQRFEYEGGSYRGRVGAIQLPDELQGVVEAVLGLDDRPVAKPHFRSRQSPGNVRWHANGGGATSFTPLQIASLYDFPPGDGQGQCVGIIELGGGERTADLSAYFSQLGIQKAPNVTAVSVDHGKNHPTGDPNGPDGEVMLDIEVVGAIAPGRNIVVYFAPNTDAGFLDAITTAVHDTTNKPSVISISWGGPESSWTPQAMTAFDSAFQAAAAMGITSASRRVITARATVSTTAPTTWTFRPQVRMYSPAAARASRLREPRSPLVCLERWCARRCRWRRREQLLRLAGVAGGTEADARIRWQPSAHHARRTGCERRRGPSRRVMTCGLMGRIP